MVQEADCIAVQGRLTIDTVPALFASGLQRLTTRDLCVDFTGVEGVDSAAISMLLGWKRAAQRGQRKLLLVGCPGELLSLARLYGVDDLLPLLDE